MCSVADVCIPPRAEAYGVVAQLAHSPTHLILLIFGEGKSRIDYLLFLSPLQQVNSAATSRQVCLSTPRQHCHSSAFPHPQVLNIPLSTSLPWPALLRSRPIPSILLHRQVHVSLIFRTHFRFVVFLATRSDRLSSMRNLYAFLRFLSTRKSGVQSLKKRYRRTHQLQQLVADRRTRTSAIWSPVVTRQKHG